MFLRDRSRPNRYKDVVASPTATQDAVSRRGWLDRDWNTIVKGAGPAIPLWGEETVRPGLRPASIGTG